MYGPETRESLLVRRNCPESDEGWREFASIYRPLVYRVARAKGLQHADAEDLTQGVLAVVELQSIASVAMRLGKSKGAIRVARCRVFNRLRVFVSEQRYAADQRTFASSGSRNSRAHLVYNEEETITGAMRSECR